MAHLPKCGLVRGHDKKIIGSCAIYFPGGINISISCHLSLVVSVFFWLPARHSLRQRRNEPWSCGVVGGNPLRGVTLPKFNIATPKWSRRYMFQGPWSLLLKFPGCTSQGTITYPTLGRGTSTSNVLSDGNCLFAGGYIWECAPQHCFFIYRNLNTCGCWRFGTSLKMFEAAYLKDAIKETN